MKRKIIKIDPRIFISPPFIECPKCNKLNSFGVLMISGHHYTRRCRECWFTEIYKLPEIKKKIVYLDQFVISNMMKAINQKLGKAKKVDPFWLKLFEKLDRLVKLQLIICPDSTFHRNESLLSYYQALKRMYEHLSGGATFYDPSTIRRFQIAEYFKQFIASIEQPKLTIEAKNVIHGQIDEWQDRIRISVDFKIQDDEIQRIKISREAVYESLMEVFKRWQSEKNKKFQDWFMEEGLAFGRVVLQRYINHLIKTYYWSIGKLNITAEETLDLVMNEESSLISNLLMYLPKTDREGISESNLKKISEFLLSKEMLNIPAIRINALLWASFAHQTAHGGRKSPPNKGMVNDIEMVSTLLPYCDAMFVDSEMFGLLTLSYVKKDLEIKHKTKIFAPSNKEEFLKYLDGIEKEASIDHLQKIKEVYGEDWPTPFFEMYEYEI
ncbi:MAG: hypothetical protein AB7D02_01845 [Candidatus Paceibacterota bacterium]